MKKSFVEELEKIASANFFFAPGVLPILTSVPAASWGAHFGLPETTRKKIRTGQRISSKDEGSHAAGVLAGMVPGIGVSLGAEALGRKGQKKLTEKIQQNKDSFDKELAKIHNEYDVQAKKIRGKPVPEPGTYTKGSIRRRGIIYKGKPRRGLHEFYTPNLKAEPKIVGKGKVYNFADYTKGPGTRPPKAYKAPKGFAGDVVNMNVVDKLKDLQARRDLKITKANSKYIKSTERFLKAHKLTGRPLTIGAAGLGILSAFQTGKAVSKNMSKK